MQLPLFKKKRLLRTSLYSQDLNGALKLTAIVTSRALMAHSSPESASAGHKVLFFPLRHSLSS